MSGKELGCHTVHWNIKRVPPSKPTIKKRIKFPFFLLIVPVVLTKRGQVTNIEKTGNRDKEFQPRGVPE